jgi:hypothetical protein
VFFDPAIIFSVIFLENAFGLQGQVVVFVSIYWILSSTVVAVVVVLV